MRKKVHTRLGDHSCSSYSEMDLNARVDTNVDGWIIRHLYSIYMYLSGSTKIIVLLLKKCLIWNYELSPGLEL